MSFACAKLVEGVTVHCEPHGTLKQYGWLPGTWVKWVKATRTFTKNVVTSAEKCGNTDFPFGFIIVGSQTLKTGFDVLYPNSNEKGYQWTADETVQFVGKNHNVELELDTNHQVSSLGAGVVTVCINHEGVYKFYAFEKYDKAYRDADGLAGNALDWDSAVGKYPSLYISSRGLLTCEKENINSIAIARAVAETGIDDVGRFILTVGL